MTVRVGTACDRPVVVLRVQPSRVAAREATKHAQRGQPSLEGEGGGGSGKSGSTQVSEHGKPRFER